MASWPPCHFINSTFAIWERFNVPVVFMARYLMVLRGATSLRGALEGVGPENQDFFGSWNGTSEASAIWAQKNWDFQDPPLPKAQSNYVAPLKTIKYKCHKKNWYIGSLCCCVVLLCVRGVGRSPCSCVLWGCIQGVGGGWQAPPPPPTIVYLLSTYFHRNESGLLCLLTQLERTQQLYWWG